MTRKVVVEMGGGVLDTAGGAEGHLFDDVCDIEAEAAAVAVEILDHGRHILEGNDDLGNAVIFEQVENVAQDGFVDKGNHGLGTPNREGTQPGAFTAGHDYGFHNQRLVASGQWSVVSVQWRVLSTIHEPLRLNGRPGIVALARQRQRILTISQQIDNATTKGFLFGGVEKQIQGALQRVGADETLQQFQVGEQLFLDRFTGELPDHGAQLILMMEADAVVNGPHTLIVAIETVTGLAVGVVDEIVEERKAAQGGGIAGIFAHIKVVDIRITFDEKLDAARPARPVTQDGGRHDGPAESLADEKGGGLALTEGADREIPEGIFAAARFVDGGDLLLTVMNHCEEGVVGTVRQQSFLFDFTFYERAYYLVVGRRSRQTGALVLVHDAAVV